MFSHVLCLAISLAQHRVCSPNMITEETITSVAAVSSLRLRTEMRPGYLGKGLGWAYTYKSNFLVLAEVTVCRSSSLQCVILDRFRIAIAMNEACISWIGLGDRSDSLSFSLPLPLSLIYHFSCSSTRSTDHLYESCS